MITTSNIHSLTSCVAFVANLIGDLPGALTRQSAYMKGQIVQTCAHATPTTVGVAWGHS